jgi:hypothetical protein
MTRVFAATLVMLLFILAFVAGGYAAAKPYQFTGIVQTVDANSITVQKTAKETWQFELAKDTKGGTPKIGARVTIHYKMVATEVEPGAGPR